ncbi:MAG TPA: protein kinase [Chloroflexota bacterium]
MSSQNQLIAGRYDLVRRIGSGGTAAVYLARDNVLGRDVAVKLLHPDVAADPIFIERLKREARAAASLNHPNIVAVYDWGRSDAAQDHDIGTYYMVMEYVSGHNLKERLANGPLAEGEALRVAMNVASALHAAHLKGVIHRDVKPQNILLTADSRVKVVDFGIARALGVTQLTRTNVVPGTPYYVAPEQVTSRQADARSDVYSLGVVLYEMLTGKEPFRGGSLVEVALKHVNEQPVPPRRHVPTLSQRAETVVLTALAKDASDRYQSAEAMAIALKSAAQAPAEHAPRDAQGAPVPAAEWPASARTVVAQPLATARQEPSYSRWLLAVPMLLLIAVVAGVAVFLRSGGPTQPSHPVAAGAHRAPATIGARKTSVVYKRHRAAGHPTTVPRATYVNPSISRATSQPTIPPTVVPVATVPPTSPPVSLPTSVALVTGSHGAGPEQAVQQFYSFVSNHQWNDAAALWTPGLRGSDPPIQYINQRFQQTSRMDVQSAAVVNEDDRSGTAAVRVSLVEHLQNGYYRVLDGTWYLVRRGSGWFLNQPVF